MKKILKLIKHIFEVWKNCDNSFSSPKEERDFRKWFMEMLKEDN